MKTSFHGNNFGGLGGQTAGGGVGHITEPCADNFSLAFI